MLQKIGIGGTHTTTCIWFFLHTCRTVCHTDPSVPSCSIDVARREGGGGGEGPARLRGTKANQISNEVLTMTRKIALAAPAVSCFRLKLSIFVVQVYAGLKFSSKVRQSSPKKPLAASIGAVIGFKYTKITL